MHRVRLSRAGFVVFPGFLRFSGPLFFFLCAFGEECRWKQRFLSSFFFLLRLFLLLLLLRLFRGEGESHGTDSDAGVGGCCWAGTLVIP